jgi:hypothetical protein
MFIRQNIILELQNIEFIRNFLYFVSRKKIAELRRLESLKNLMSSRNIWNFIHQKLVEKIQK